MNQSDKVNLVDLDGTLIKGNSFHIWCYSIFFDSAPALNFNKNYKLRIRLIFILVLRLLKRIDHVQLKRYIQGLWFHLPTIIKHQSNAKMVERLNHVMDKQLLRILQAASDKNELIILTTAAPQEYVVPFIDELKIFDYVIATPAHQHKNWYHNIAMTKREKTMELIIKLELPTNNITLYTDHIDDEPLMEISNNCYLYSPARKYLDILSRQYPNTNFRIA